MAVKKLFLNTMGNTTYIFADGTKAAFRDGEYATNIVAEITELEAQIAAGHPNIKVDPTRLEVDGDNDPMVQLRKKIAEQAVEDYKAQQAALGRDMGSTAENGSSIIKGIATSATIADGAAGSDSSASAAIASLQLTPIVSTIAASINKK